MSILGSKKPHVMKVYSGTFTILEPKDMCPLLMKCRHNSVLFKAQK